MPRHRSGTRTEPRRELCSILLAAAAHLLAGAYAFTSGQPEHQVSVAGATAPLHWLEFDAHEPSGPDGPSAALGKGPTNGAQASSAAAPTRSEPAPMRPRTHHPSEARSRATAVASRDEAAMPTQPALPATPHAAETLVGAARHELGTDEFGADAAETSDGGFGSDLRSGGWGHAGSSHHGGAGAPEPDRSHAARLLAGRADPCAGLFPWDARVDDGTVLLALEVTPAGLPQRPRIVQESPRGHGFAEAARSCLHRIRFEPAADREGAPIASRSVVRLRFHREN